MGASDDTCHNLAQTLIEASVHAASCKRIAEKGEPLTRDLRILLVRVLFRQAKPHLSHLDEGSACLFVLNRARNLQACHREATVTL